MAAPHGGARLQDFVRGTWNGSLQSLADRAGVSVQAIYKWFRGEGEPSVDLLQKLAKALKVPGYVLFATYAGEDIEFPEIGIPAGDGRILRISVQRD